MHSKKIGMKTLKLSKIQREILTGILLSNGNLLPDKHKIKYVLTISQSEKHKNYVFHLYEIFKNFTVSPPKIYIFTNKRFPGKIYRKWYFNTIPHIAFRFYAHQFYLGKIRVVPKLIHKWLSPRAIAYWYMDDITHKCKGKSSNIRFCTDAYTLSMVKSLIFVLENKYNLKCFIQKNKNRFRIYISSECYHKIKNLIYPFIIPCMHYKFNILP